MFLLPKYTIHFYLKSFQIKLKNSQLYFKLNSKNEVKKKALQFKVFLVKKNYFLPFYTKAPLKINKIINTSFNN
jgi:hypothetical protein